MVRGQYKAKQVTEDRDREVGGGKHTAAVKEVVSVGRIEMQTETKTPKVSLWGECFTATRFTRSTLVPQQHLKIQKSF